MFLFLFFFVSWFEFKTKLVFVFVLVKKSYNISCVCAHESLNRLPPSSLHLLFVFCFCFWPCKYVYVLKINNGVHGRIFCNCFDMSNKRINLFVTLSCMSKIIKLQHHQGVFRQHKFQQRSLESIFLTSLTRRIQNFEVLSIRCAWSFDFIFIIIHMD